MSGGGQNRDGMHAAAGKEKKINAPHTPSDAASRARVFAGGGNQRNAHWQKSSQPTNGRAAPAAHVPMRICDTDQRAPTLRTPTRGGVDE